MDVVGVMGIVGIVDIVGMAFQNPSLHVLTCVNIMELPKMNSTF